MGTPSTTAPQGATTFTTTAAKPVKLSLEDVTGDISTIAVFCECLEKFICDLRAVVRAEADQQSIFDEINSVDTLAYEIKHRVQKMREGIDAFIDAAPAAHLWAERPEA